MLNLAQWRKRIFRLKINTHDHPIGDENTWISCSKYEKFKNIYIGFLRKSKSRQNFATIFFFIAILGSVYSIVFCPINSIGCLSYVKFDEDSRNGLTFEFWASFTLQIFIYSNLYILYNVKIRVLKKYEKSPKYQDKCSKNTIKEFKYIRLFAQQLLPKSCCEKLQKCGVYLQ